MSDRAHDADIPKDSSTSRSGKSKDSFTKGLAGAMVKKALVPLAASGATAGTAYLTRKASALWQERIAPAVEEKGGPRAALKELLEGAAGKTGGRVSATLSGLAERLGDGGSETSTASTTSQDTATPSDDREEERKERRRRRQARQRALEKSGSS